MIALFLSAVVQQQLGRAQELGTITVEARSALRVASFITI